MTQLIDDASVWAGDELLSRPDWKIDLTPNEIEEIKLAISKVTPNDVGQYDFGDCELPELGPRLKVIQNTLENGSGATLIRGFPIDQFTESESTAAFYLIASQIGTPISQSATGERIFHVRDAGFKDNDPRARGPNTKKETELSHGSL